MVCPKIQVQSLKQSPILKSIPKFAQRPAFLEFGIWPFFGALNFELGVSIGSRQIAPDYFEGGPSRPWPTASVFTRPSSAPRPPRPAGSSGLRIEARPTAGTSARPNRNHRRPARAEHWPRPQCRSSRRGSQQCDETTDDAFAYSNMNSLAWLNPSRQDATAKLPFVYDPQ